MRITMKTVLLGSLALVGGFAFGGCEGSTDRMPTGPTPTLVVQAFSTATDSEPNAVRVQVRLRTVSGLERLAGAAQSGSARARVCLAGSCVNGGIEPRGPEGSCDGVMMTDVAGTDLGFATAWLDRDVVGVDFCVRSLTEEREYQTTILDGLGQSNVVRTVCAPAGAGLFCVSG